MVAYPTRMTRKTAGKTEGPSGRKGPLWVVHSKKQRQRFLRGMVTHDLVQRGLGFDSSYAVAQSIRDLLSDREEVTTAELRDLIAEQLERIFGAEIPLELRSPFNPPSELTVHAQGQDQPFSRGLLARSIHAAGLDLDRSYRLVTELEGDLRSEGIDKLDSGEIARRVGDILERLEDKEAARRYRLIRRIHRLPRPLILYIGGASGTGKSTLALELAPLLRIYRINATDTIRQVMRMVFTPSILPALHSSSFEAAPFEPGKIEETPSTPRDPDFAHRVEATFEEQATRVCVGVRAVAERAAAENMSIVVEGVHLHPAIIPFPDLDGAAYQIPMVMVTLDEEVHRARFLTRARTGTRLAERYLENFASIRFVHDHILQLAEQFDRPLVDSSHGTPAVSRTLRVVTSVLEKRIPLLTQTEHKEKDQAAPGLLLIIDGLPDRPVRALGNRSPLQAAKTPTLDRLAREGQCGLADPISPGVVADTAAGSLALFAQSPLALKRGPVEALGAGLQLSPGDIALRANLATLDQTGQVIDRRAGRIREGASQLAKALDRLPIPGGAGEGIEIRVANATEHRLAIVLRGASLSSEIYGSDPGEGAPAEEPLVPRPIDPEDDQATQTANLLALFEQEARRVLSAHPVNKKRRKAGLPPANAILTRGAGRIHRLISLEEAGLPLQLSCIGGDRTVLGLARWLGARIVTSDAMTANLDSDLHAKFEAARQELRHNDLVIVHVKGADIAAHDQRPDLKVEFLEKIDTLLGKLIKDHRGPLRVAVASDHATLSESGQHAADPLPVLIWGDNLEADDVQTFDETTAGKGLLQRFPLQLLLGRLFDLS